MNTLSNLPVILVGLILIKTFKGSFLKLYGAVSAVVGIASFAYHATNNGLSQYVDFLGMFLLSSFLLNFNFLRILRRNPAKISLEFFLIYLLHLALLLPVYFLEMPIQYTVLGPAAFIVIFDLSAGVFEKSFSVYKFAVFGILFFAAAQFFAIVDAHKMYCDPENLFFHGHVLWHIFAAVGTVLYGFHLKAVLLFNEST